MKQNIKLGYTKNERRRAISGLLFVLPWAIGAVAFFILPIIQTFWNSLNVMTVSKTGQGFEYAYTGFSNYKDIFITDSTFLRQFAASIGNMIVNVPVIVLFSLFTAIILKEKFLGRTAFRAIFFLPVIIASGVVIAVLQENVMSADVAGAAVSSAQSGGIFAAPSFEQIFENLSVPVGVLNFVTGVVNRLFDLTWKSGVQILLLLAAVNSVPRSAYEAADMEGATVWEKFWKITFPLVTPTLLVAVVYTIIDSFTDYGNEIIRTIQRHFSGGMLAYSSAVGFTYFIAILLVIGIVYGLLSKMVFYENN